MNSGGGLSNGFDARPPLGDTTSSLLPEAALKSGGALINGFDAIPPLGETISSFFSAALNSGGALINGFEAIPPLGERGDEGLIAVGGVATDLGESNGTGLAVAASGGFHTFGDEGDLGDDGASGEPAPPSNMASRPLLMELPVRMSLRLRFFGLAPSATLIRSNFSIPAGRPAPAFGTLIFADRSAPSATAMRSKEPGMCCWS